MYRITFADAVRQPRLLKPMGLVFDGEGVEVRRFKDDEVFVYQTFCICGAHQLEPGSLSAANRWRKQHQHMCKPQLTQE